MFLRVSVNSVYTIEAFIDDSNEDDLKLFEPQLKVLLEKHFEKVQELFSKHPKKAADFTLLFKSVNTYLRYLNLLNPAETGTFSLFSLICLSSNDSTCLSAMILA
jgi:hypothetical protein